MLFFQLLLHTSTTRPFSFTWSRAKIKEVRHLLLKILLCFHFLNPTKIFRLFSSICRFSSTFSTKSRYVFISSSVLTYIFRAFSSSCGPDMLHFFKQSFGCHKQKNFLALLSHLVSVCIKLLLQNVELKIQNL